MLNVRFLIVFSWWNIDLTGQSEDRATFVAIGEGSGFAPMNTEEFVMKLDDEKGYRCLLYSLTSELHWVLFSFCPKMATVCVACSLLENS